MTLKENINNMVLKALKAYDDMTLKRKIICMIVFCVICFIYQGIKHERESAKQQQQWVQQQQLRQQYYGGGNYYNTTPYGWGNYNNSLLGNSGTMDKYERQSRMDRLNRDIAREEEFSKYWEEKAERERANGEIPWQSGSYGLQHSIRRDKLRRERDSLF